MACTAPGHTRWATHGRPTEENAHPHRDCTGRIVVVHNGIIENSLELKRELQQEGHQFKTETDTEIVAHLVEREMRDDGLEQAVRRALKVMRGMFYRAVPEDPEKIVAVRNGPPIVVGLGDKEFFVASTSRRFSATHATWCFGDEEMAVITRSRRRVHRLLGTRSLEDDAAGALGSDRREKGGHRHFMLKEIRAANGRSRHHPRSRLDDRGQIFLEDSTSRKSRSAPPEGHDHRLRHLLARGARRQVFDRGARPGPRRSGLRIRVSLSQSDHQLQRACDRHHAVR